jgi:hypothetical protein
MSNRILINGFELEGMKLKMAKEVELIEVDGKKSFDDKIKEKEEEKKNKIKNKKNNKIVTQDEKIQMYKNIFLKSILKINKLLNKILNFYSNSQNDKMLKTAHNFFVKENSFIIKHDQKHPEIIKLNDLLETFYIKREEKLTNLQKEELKNSVFYFYARQKILKNLNQFDYQITINKFSNEINNVEEFKNKEKIFEKKDFEENDEIEEKKEIFEKIKIDVKNKANDIINHINDEMNDYLNKNEKIEGKKIQF